MSIEMAGMFSRFRSWLLFRLFGWGSPSLHIIGHTETLRWVITGRLADADGESIAAVCAELEVTRQTFYNWKDNYPDFCNAVEVGLLKSQRDWERVGRDGIVGNLEKFAGSPWMFTMKNRFRSDYQDDRKEEKDESTSLLEKIISGEIKIQHDEPK